MFRQLFQFVLLLGLICGCSYPRQATTTRIMTFNVRYGTADDRENHWNKRQSSLLQSITHFSPDLLCTQETLAMQRDFMKEKLSGYDCVAVGRDDGKETGEMTAILFNRGRFELVESGHFWLSSTPEVVGSIGWDAVLTRMASWVKLRDRSDPHSRPILLINAHLDHRGRQSRIESCKLINTKAHELDKDARILIAGDFNCSEDDPAYAALLGNDFHDAYRMIHPSRSKDEATFHAFKPQNMNGSRIDWIMIDRSFKPIQADIDRSLYDGKIPSDHFPVKVILESIDIP